MLEVKKAEFIVHWPGQDTPACEAHAKKLKNLAVYMGFVVSASACQADALCANCVNEAKKELQAELPSTKE
jgi:hypothetical protein